MFVCWQLRKEFLGRVYIRSLFQDVYGEEVGKHKCKCLHAVCSPSDWKLKVSFYSVMLAVHTITYGVPEDEVIIWMTTKMCLTPGVGIVKQGLFKTLYMVSSLQT